MRIESIDTWKLVEKQHDLHNALLYESLFSLGNGYMGARGFHPEEAKAAHEAMTFVAGVFDYIKPGISDFVNTPNVFYLRLYIDDELINPFNYKIFDYTRELDMKTGVLHRRFIARDHKERNTLIEYSRLFSLAEKHLIVSKYKVTPLNYSGNIAISAGIDGSSANNPIPDDQLKSDNEIIALFEIKKTEHYSKNAAYMEVCTKVSGTSIAEAISVVCSDNSAIYSSTYTNRAICVNCSKAANKDSAAEFDIFTAVYTSKDGLQDIEAAAKEMAVEAAFEGYEKALQDTSAAWAEKWDICDIEIKGDDKLEQGLRYNVFQLISSNSQEDDKVSIGARGLTHSRYKGCFFWDTEIFMLPFYLYTNPEAAKNLLMFRYNTLKAAEQNAKSQNLKGARYPWMCNTDGLEQCDTWDIGFSEVHITADIAYAVDHYVRATGDAEFYLDFGAEILIKTARYWSSRFTYDEQNDLYNLLFVKGPNEYGGVTLNNTYTVWMALHNLELGKKAIAALMSERENKWLNMKAQIDFDESELQLWDDILAKAKINYDKARNLYIEDDNFYKLEPLDIKKFKNGDEPLYKRICFDRLQRYRVIKQADIILLMCLFPDKFNELEKTAAWYEYEPITLHDSSLSYATHAQFAAMIGLQNETYDYLMKGIRLDIDNIMKNTGKEGIHFASAGAAWQALIFGLCGVQVEKDGLSFDPVLPKHIEQVRFKLLYKGRKYKVEIDNRSKSFQSSLSIVD